MLILVAGLTLAASLGPSLDQPDPNSWRTYNPAETQETIQQNTCVKGWTSTARPPFFIAQTIKRSDWLSSPAR